MGIYLQIVIAVLGVAGFLVCLRIHKDKKKKVFVCPLNFDCHAVTSSKYSKLFGVPLEIGGMLYYAAVTLAYAFLLLVPKYLPPYFSEAMIVISIGALVFSFFLVWVQAFRLREWCSWCLVSASISTVIAILVYWLALV